MPSLENLTQQELDGLTAKSRLAEVLYDNPETRKDFVRLLKKADPKIRLPELDAEEATAEVRKEMQERLDKEEAARKELEFRERVRDNRARAVKAGVPEAEIETLEKFMADNGIPDHEKAAKLYLVSKRAEVPAPSIREQTQLQMPGEKELFKNPTAWARQTAEAALADIQNQRTY